MWKVIIYCGIIIVIADDYDILETSRSVCKSTHMVLYRKSSYNLENPLPQKCVLQFSTAENLGLHVWLSSSFRGKSYNLTLSHQFATFNNKRGQNADPYFQSNWKSFDVFAAFPPGKINLTIDIGKILPEHQYRGFDDLPMHLTLLLTPHEDHQDMSRVDLWTNPQSGPIILNSNSYFSEDSPIFNTTTRQHASTWVIRSNTRVVVSKIGQDVYYDGYWLSTWIYEGEGPEARLVGTAYDIQDKPFVSSGKVVTIYATAQLPLYGQLIINDYENVMHLGEMKQYWSCNYDLHYKNCSFVLLTMNASNGPATLVIGSYPGISEPYLVGIEFTVSSTKMKENVRFMEQTQFYDPNATLIAYAGGPARNPLPYLLATYDSSNYTDSLPQFFPGNVRTFQLDRGSAVLNISTFYGIAAGWLVPRNNRRGFLMTSYYFDSALKGEGIPTFKMSNDTSEFYNYTLDYQQGIRNSSINYTLEAFTVEGYRNFSGYVSELKNFTMRAKGFNFSVSESNGTISGGFVRFEMKSGSCPSCLGATLIAIFIAFLMLALLTFTFKNTIFRLLYPAPL